MADLYAIVGIKKLKTEGNIGGVISHAFRQRITPNSAKKENLILIAPPTLPQIMKEINSYPNKRKNSVLCYDFLLTASPEFFTGKTMEQVKEWADTSLSWACEYFGRNNVKAGVLHLDEQTPHLQLLIVPEHDNKLDARYYTGGRDKMRKLWTEYARACRKYGLKRGREYSPAKHKDIKAYYADVRRGKELKQDLKFAPEDLPAPTLEDRMNPAEYAVEIINEVISVYQEQNGNLQSALEATRRELDRLIARASAERKPRKTKDHASSMVLIRGR